MTPANPSLLRAAALTVRISAIVSATGIVFLVGMFAAFATGDRTTGQRLGFVNDTLVLATYLLTAPTVVALASVTPARRPVAIVVPLAGLGGIAWVVAWQALLVGGAVTFEQQIGPVAAGYWVLGAWFIVAGHRASRAGLVERGGWMGLVGATYIGYPVWAVWIGRRLDRLAATVPGETPRPAT